jgi:hypothetical protein
MKIVCANCRVPVPGEDVNVARMVAKCRACGAVFRFDDQLVAPTGTPSGLVQAPSVPMPPGIVVRHEGAAGEGDYRHGPESGELTITRRWFTPSAIFLAIFAVVWNSFLVFWYSMAFAGGAPWIFFVFPILHVSAGLWITHKALSGLFNTTVIRVAAGRLSVRHGPIPVRGARDIPVEQVRQLYTEQIVSSKGQRHYNVQIVVATGPTLTLVTDLQSPQQALFLEQRLESQLRIADQTLPGAFRG